MSHSLETVNGLCSGTLEKPVAMILQTQRRRLFAVDLLHRFFRSFLLQALFVSF